MRLYEVTCGLDGESYVRVYAWCATEQAALLMAERAFKVADYVVHPADLVVRELFSSDMEPFVTTPSDSGWED